MSHLKHVFSKSQTKPTAEGAQNSTPPQKNLVSVLTSLVGLQERHSARKNTGVTYRQKFLFRKGDEDN